MKLNHLIVQFTLNTIQLLWTMSILSFYLKDKNKDSLIEYLKQVKIQLHEKVSNENFLGCMKIINKSLIKQIYVINEEMRSQFQEENNFMMTARLSNCFNGLVHSWQFMKKLPMSFWHEINSTQWAVLIHEFELMISDWRTQLNKFGIISTKLVEIKDLPDNFLSKFEDISM